MYYEIDCVIRLTTFFFLIHTYTRKINIIVLKIKITGCHIGSLLNNLIKSMTILKILDNIIKQIFFFFFHMSNFLVILSLYSKVVSTIEQGNDSKSSFYISGLGFLNSLLINS